MEASRKQSILPHTFIMCKLSAALYRLPSLLKEQKKPLEEIAVLELPSPFGREKWNHIEEKIHMSIEGPACCDTINFGKDKITFAKD